MYRISLKLKVILDLGKYSTWSMCTKEDLAYANYRLCDSKDMFTYIALIMKALW